MIRSRPCSNPRENLFLTPPALAATEGRSPSCDTHPEGTFSLNKIRENMVGIENKNDIYECNMRANHYPFSNVLQGHQRTPAFCGSPIFLDSLPEWSDGRELRKAYMNGALQVKEVTNISMQHQVQFDTITNGQPGSPNPTKKAAQLFDCHMSPFQLHNGQLPTTPLEEEKTTKTATPPAAALLPPPGVEKSVHIAPICC